MAYIKEMYNDVTEWINDNCDITVENGNITTEHGTRMEFEEWLIDRLYNQDSITGNGSGSYTCNSWEAEQHIRDEFDMFLDMVKDFDYSAEQVGTWFLNEEWETMDVLVRCWLLPSVIAEVLDDIESGVNELLP